MIIDSAMTSWAPLFEQQMKDLMKSEGFPIDGWTPKYKVEETKTGIQIRFLDDKSKAWFRHFRKRVDDENK